MRSDQQPPSPVSPPVGQLTCIFTDIVDSTALWALSESEASEAINTHDTIIRAEILRHGGYEVKNLGDGFFIVFAHAHAALRFCLGAQHALYHASWPPEIVAHRARHVRGLTVRMGCHYGKLYSEVIDPVHKRFDYRGIVGCVASRVHQLADGDEIALSDAFLYALQAAETNRAAKLVELDDEWRTSILSDHVSPSMFCLETIGKQDLRGVMKSENITMIRLKRGMCFEKKAKRITLRE